MNVGIEIHQAFAMIVAILIRKLSLFTFVLVNRSYRSHWTPNEIYCGFSQHFITSEEAFNLAKVAFLALSKWVLLTLLLSHHPFILLYAHLLEQADALIILIIPSSCLKSVT